MRETKYIDAAAVISWATWGGSHLQQVDAALQFVMLLIGLSTTIWSLGCHVKTWRKK